MKRTDIRTESEQEARVILKALKEEGFVKVADCMWVKIFEKESHEVVVVREY